jgi:hypothetical protein
MILALWYPGIPALQGREDVNQPLHGITSKTRLYRILYSATGPLITLCGIFLRGWVTTTGKVGRAMIKVAMRGAPKRYLENRDINIASG